MRTESKLLLLAFMCGITFWVIDARLDYAVLSGNSFLGALTYDAPAHKWNIRLVVMVLFLAFGETAARLWAQRRRVEEQVKREKDMAENYLNTAGVVLASLDAEGCITMINRKGCEVLSYTRQELLGRNWMELVPEDTRDTVWGVFGKLMRGQVEPVEYYQNPVTTKDGAERLLSFHNTVLRGNDGQINGVLFSAEDITERKRTEKELTIRERAIESSINGIVLGDLNGNITYANPAFLQMWGYEDQEEAVGRHFGDFWQDREQARRIVRCLRQKGSRTAELTARRKDGSLFPVELSASLVGDNDGNPVCMMSSLGDISERKKAERRLRSLNAELQRSNRDLEDFAHTVSHDLQEPLRVVSSYVQLLEKRYGDRLDGDAEEFIGYAVDGTRRMRQLIHDLLAYSRVGTRGKPFKPTDCESLLSDVLESLKTTIEETGTTVTHAPLPTVTGDASQLEQVLQNLVSNAIKYRRPSEPPRIHISAERRGDEWLFSVRDNGIGIEKQYADRIFRIFQRLHAGSEYGGTGVGLAICKRVVERHRGRIWVESEPGKGSTFYFTIPRTADRSASARPAGRPSLSAAHTLENT